MKGLISNLPRQQLFYLPGGSDLSNFKMVEIVIGRISNWSNFELVEFLSGRNLKCSNLELVEF